VDIEKLIRELVRDEALRLKPYHCPAGKLTIGIGRNLDDVGLSAEEARALGVDLAGDWKGELGRRGITEEQAFLLCRSDVAKVQAQLDVKLPWWKDLEDARQRVLANMAFNMGIAGLLGFKNTLELVRCGQYVDAANHMLDSKWARQVGVGTEEKPGRALRLALMMRDGKVFAERNVA
jgi:lysozyme